jgi:hypothetical protein
VPKEKFERISGKPVQKMSFKNKPVDGVVHEGERGVGGNSSD